MMPPLADKASLLRQVRGRRDHWDRDFRPLNLQQAGAGQESVWDYPRPPITQPVPATITIFAGKRQIARSDAALEMKETAGAPVPYLPPGDVRTDWLVPNGGVSVCEWKGAALAYDLIVPSELPVRDAAWSYPDPFDDLPEGYRQIAGWFAFYPAKLVCFVGDEQARPQPGGFDGGWVTDRVRGPIKGTPGSSGW